MPFSRNLQKRLLSLPLTRVPNIKPPVVKDFGILVEMHQDKDGSVPQFRHAFVRGECAPIKVHLNPVSLELYDDQGHSIVLDWSMKFLTIEGWSQWVMDYIMTNGTSPIINGVMPTRYLRDARAGRNLFKSFRQIINANYAKKGAGTNAKP